MAKHLFNDHPLTFLNYLTIVTSEKHMQAAKKEKEKEKINNKPKDVIDPIRK